MKYSFKADKSETLLDFLSSQLGGVGIAALKEQLKRREIKINDARVSQNAYLSIGDNVEIFLPARFSVSPVINIIYTDDNIVAADKPPMVETEGFLKRKLEDKFGQVYPVHRLDRNTKGIVLFAKNEKIRQELTFLIKSRSFIKKYSALVKGRPQLPEDTLKAYIHKDTEDSLCTVSCSKLPGYKEIITGYSIKRIAGDISLLQITLITGRTHQIRAHMAYVGHPVLGDGKYGDSEINKKYGCRRQQLIASELTLSGLSGGLTYLNDKKFISEMTFDILPDYID